MPRKGKGGARTGTAGTAYANRTDLQGGTQPIKVAPSTQYGEGAKLQAAQRAMPLPDNSGLPPQAASGAMQGAPPVQGPLLGAPNGPLPGELGAFDRATERPGEHVSTGLPVGPGAGPEVMSQRANPNAQLGIQLRAMYRVNPNQDLLDLIQQFDAENGGVAL
jgi:hypothetical protein